VDVTSPQYLTPFVEWEMERVVRRELMAQVRQGQGQVVLLNGGWQRGVRLVHLQATILNANNEDDLRRQHLEDLSQGYRNRQRHGRLAYNDRHVLRLKDSSM
jgi:hypothetical protein